MMYSEKMALAVKADGKVLREAKNGDSTTVYLPFGCDYSLLIKNLNSVRALVKVWIDGTDVTGGAQLVVRANDSMDLERFIKDGNLDAGNKFKFIERTRAISNHRGNKIDDGLIRLEFEFERQPQPFVHRPFDWYRSGPIYGGPYYGSGVGVCGAGETFSATASNTHAAYGGEYSGAIKGSSIRSNTQAFVNQVGADTLKHTPVPNEAESETGITVAGGVSSQQFKVGSAFPTDGVKHVMVMQMLGEIEGHVVEQPVTVHMKPTCSSCGKVNKATSRFCSQCGTGLQLV